MDSNYARSGLMNKRYRKSKTNVLGNNSHNSFQDRPILDRNLSLVELRSDRIDG
jgi:hypothetical protein